MQVVSIALALPKRKGTIYHCTHDPLGSLGLCLGGVSVPYCGIGFGIDRNISAAVVWLPHNTHLSFSTAAAAAAATVATSLSLARPGVACADHPQRAAGSSGGPPGAAESPADQGVSQQTVSTVRFIHIPHTSCCAWLLALTMDGVRDNDGCGCCSFMHCNAACM